MNLIQQAETTDKHWVCVQTKARREELATRTLVNKEVVVFNPKIEECYMRFNHNVSRLVPLFPGYIFANINLAQERDKVRWAPGVKTILSDSRGPIAVDESIISGIVLELENRKRTVVEDLKRGDAIVVNHGVFGGLTGIFQSRSSGVERVKVLLEILYRQVVVEIDRSHVSKAC